MFYVLQNFKFVSSLASKARKEIVKHLHICEVVTLVAEGAKRNTEVILSIFTYVKL